MTLKFTKPHPPVAYRVRLKPGKVLVMQDHSCFIWPGPFYKDKVDTQFKAYVVENTIVLKAPGFGESGNYGSGALYLKANRQKLNRG